MNPPYSKPGPWCQKAYEHSLKGNTVVGLLRGDTSTRWFHDWIIGPTKKPEDMNTWLAKCRFLKGRVKFNGKPAPFPSIIAVWCPPKEQ